MIVGERAVVDEHADEAFGRGRRVLIRKQIHFGIFRKIIGKIVAVGVVHFLSAALVARHLHFGGRTFRIAHEVGGDLLQVVEIPAAVGAQVEDEVGPPPRLHGFEAVFELGGDVAAELVDADIGGVFVEGGEAILFAEVHHGVFAERHAGLAVAVDAVRPLIFFGRDVVIPVPVVRRLIPQEQDKLPARNGGDIGCELLVRREGDIRPRDGGIRPHEIGKDAHPLPHPRAIGGRIVGNERDRARIVAPEEGNAVVVVLPRARAQIVGVVFGRIVLRIGIEGLVERGEKLCARCVLARAFKYLLAREAFGIVVAFGDVERPQKGAHVLVDRIIADEPADEEARGEQYERQEKGNEAALPRLFARGAGRGQVLPLIGACFGNGIEKFVLFFGGVGFVEVGIHRASLPHPLGVEQFVENGDDAEGDRIGKFADVEPRDALDLIETVHEGVAVHKEIARGLGDVETVL